MNAPQEADFDKWRHVTEPHVLSEQELVDIEAFLARDWPPEVIGDYPEELITHQANFAPSLVLTVREFQRRSRSKAPADWLDPEELNGRIALAVDAMNHARGFIEDADAHDLSPGPVLCAEQIERLDRGISALTDPSKY